jgi:hypothetical protein
MSQPLFGLQGLRVSVSKADARHLRAEGSAGHPLLSRQTADESKGQGVGDTNEKVAHKYGGNMRAVDHVKFTLT